MSLPSIRYETVQFYGETRYRFWIDPSPVFAPNAESDGGIYEGRREAQAAAQEVIRHYQEIGLLDESI